MKKTRKLFFAVEIIIAIIFAVSLTRSYYIRKTRESYAYAQKWCYTLKLNEPVYDFQNSLEESEDLNSLLRTCEDYYEYSSLKTDYDFLFWDNFKDVQIFFSNKASEIIGTDVYAMYIKEGNFIVVQTSDFYLQSSDKQKSIIIHELAHALTTSDANFFEGQGFSEAVAEDLAFTVCKQNGIDYNITYSCPFCLYMLVWNIFGKTDTLKAHCEGELNNKINDISDGYGSSLRDMLTALNCYELYDEQISFDYTEIVYMAQDIIVHATVNQANLEPDSEAKQEMLDNCLKGLLIKDEYFSRLLSH